MSYLQYIWSNYSDLTRVFTPNWWFSKGNPLISGKSRLVKYSLARYIFLVSPEFPPLEFATKPLTDKVTWDGGYPTKSPTDIEKVTFESTNKYLGFIVWLPPTEVQLKVFVLFDSFSWLAPSCLNNLCDRVFFSRHSTPSSKEPVDFCVGRVDGNQRGTALIFCQLNHLRFPSLKKIKWNRFYAYIMHIYFCCWQRPRILKCHNALFVQFGWNQDPSKKHRTLYL